MRKIFAIGIFITICFSMVNSAAQSRSVEQELNQIVLKSMEQYHVPAVSLAIIDHHRLVYAHAYSIEPDLKVNNKSLFQAASLSKSVTAFGALLLVDQEKISLDKNVNDYLRSWKVTENAYTKKSKVTLRHLLDMTSGLSVSGFAGNEINDKLPTLQQILNGERPASNEPVKVFFTPGSKYFYSGGSYEVVQQLIEDVSHATFANFMDENVFEPLGMRNSHFISVLPKYLQNYAVPGFLKEGNRIPGNWKIIAALAAGGMWTTPTDLTKFVLNVMKSYHGKTSGLLSKNLARTMLTRQENTDFGLGVIVDGCNKNLNFRKEGHNLGFYNWLIVFPNTGQGAVVMTNSENGVPVIQAIIKRIAQFYKWPTHYPLVDESEQIPESMRCPDRYFPRSAVFNQY
ncbi:MAG: serine hydrolase domain-containing protein [Gammaproteobacteria bacterium]